MPPQGPSVPTRFVLWMATYGLAASLAEALWQALCRSRHPVAGPILWTFERLERLPMARFRAHLLGHLARVSPQEYAAVLEDLVAHGHLARAEGNPVLEGWLQMVDHQGQWR